MQQSAAHSSTSSPAKTRRPKPPRHVRETSRIERRAAREQVLLGDDPIPADIDAFRNEMARRIERAIGTQDGLWRGCREDACRRHRACLAPRIHCSNAPPLPPATEKEQARMSAMMQRALSEAAARHDAEEAEKSSVTPDVKARGRKAKGNAA